MNKCVICGKEFKHDWATPPGWPYCSLECSNRDLGLKQAQATKESRRFYLPPWPWLKVGGLTYDIEVDDALAAADDLYWTYSKPQLTITLDGVANPARRRHSLLSAAVSIVSDSYGLDLDEAQKATVASVLHGVLAENPLDFHSRLGPSLPMTLKVSGLEYRVVREDRLSEVQRAGDISGVRLVVRIYSGAKARCQSEALLHEILHAIDRACHLDIPHGTLTALAYALHQVLVDNDFGYHEGEEVPN